MPHDIDEPVGSGRWTVMSVEPNYRAFTTGFQKILRNAILSRDTAGSARTARASSARRARRAATKLVGGSDTIRQSVRAAGAARVRTVLSSLGARWTERRSPGRVAFLVDNPRGLTADEHPFASKLPRALRDVRVTAITVRAP